MNIKVLFVCMGNICRSPAAQAVFEKLIKAKNLEDKFVVDSAGTISFHSGEKADSRMINEALKRGLNITSISRQITKEDTEKFDFIIVMDDQNHSDVLRLTNNKDKVLKITNFLSEKYSDYTQIPDPYYGSNNGFKLVLDLLEDSCVNLLNHLLNS